MFNNTRTRSNASDQSYASTAQESWARQYLYVRNMPIRLMVPLLVYLAGCQRESVRLCVWAGVLVRRRQARLHDIDDILRQQLGLSEKDITIQASTAACPYAGHGPQSATVESVQKARRGRVCTLQDRLRTTGRPPTLQAREPADSSFPPNFWKGSGGSQAARMHGVEPARQGRAPVPMRFLPLPFFISSPSAGYT
jgi:hypothetical protein